jgi:hypothetical protein
MKTVFRSILCFGALPFAASILHAQDLSKYRGFSLGTSLATILKQTNQRPADVSATHVGPPLFQEVTWWPPSPPGASLQSDSVQQLLFSFYNGVLYKISVTYDPASTEGLTAADMVKSISAKYGPPTTVTPDLASATPAPYEVKEQLVASWEDSQYSFHLLRSSFTDRLGLVMSSKRLNAEAELAIVESVKLEALNGPKLEAERQEKQTTELELKRQKNKKSFRP